MMKYLFTSALLAYTMLVCVPAHAQQDMLIGPGPVPPDAVINLRLASPPVGIGSTTPNTGAFTTLGLTGGLKIGGQNAISVSSAANEPSLFIGPYCGASSAAGSQFYLCVGPYSLASMTAATPEVVAIGHGAGIKATTGKGFIAIGTSAGASQTTGSDFVAIGTNCMRNVQDGAGSLCLGTGAYVNGNSSGSNWAIGNNALAGSASTITIGGSITVGDVMKFTFTSSNSCNGTTIVINCTTGAPVTFSYVVGATDTTLTLLASRIATAMSGNTGINYTLGNGVNEGSLNLFQVGFVIWDAANFPTVIKGHYPASWKLSISYSCTGTCGETAAIGAGFTGSTNLVWGADVFSGVMVTSPSNNVFISPNGAGALVTNPNETTALGYRVAPNMTNGSFNVFMGSLAAASCAGCSQNVLIGARAGGSLTSNGNVIVGDQAGGGQSCITSGGSNVQLGASSCVASPNSSGQLSIQNIIYGTSNTGQVATVSTGSIGIGQPAPGARFDILGKDSSAGTLSLRIQNSALTTLLSVSNSGVTTFGFGPVINGSTSGTVTLTPPAVAGSTVLTLPAQSGTLGLAIAATTASIGGGALIAGACTSGTVTATGATTAMAVASSPVTYPGDGSVWISYVSAANTVTVKVCAIIAVTPTASAYNIRVIQ